MMQPAFQRSYPLSPGPYLWIPPLGVGLLPALSFVAPFLLLVLPFALVLSFVPAWILGGRLNVHAQPGYVKLTRSRFTWQIVRELAFPPHELPQIQATRPYGHKPHAVLRVGASTGYREIALALHDALVPVAADLDAYFRQGRVD